MTSERAVVEMQREGFRPARIEELLALGAQHPELQRSFPIVALGSVWKKSNILFYVPCLCLVFDAYRTLSLGDFGSVWDDQCRFAAVPN